MEELGIRAPNGVAGCGGEVIRRAATCFSSRHDDERAVMERAARSEEIDYTERSGWARR
jgi:hypothetical protein